MLAKYCKTIIAPHVQKDIHFSVFEFEHNFPPEGSNSQKNLLVVFFTFVGPSHMKDS